MNNYIRLRTFALFTVLIVTLYSISAVAQSESTSSKIIQSPEATVEAFYRWYLVSLSQNREPLKKGKATLKKYVTEGLINKIEKQLKSPDGLDADYFLQAQDFLEDWERNISVTKSVIKGTVATTIVVLGAKDESRHKLNVSLRQEFGTWKIKDVQQLRQ